MSGLDVFGTPIPFPGKRMTKYEKLKNGAISDWMMASLYTVATKRIGPTIATRFYFLCGVAIYDVLRVIHTSWKLVDMTKELGSFPYSLPESDYDAWIEVGIHDAFFEIYKFFGYPLDELEKVSNSHELEYRKIYRMIQSPNNPQIRQNWKDRVKLYLSKRSNDNSNVAGTFTPSSQYPNSGQFISTNGSTAMTQDLTMLPNANLWCGLEIESKGKIQRQNYLTPEWGDVVGLISTRERDTLVNRISNTFYPSSEVLTKEIKELLEICQNLSDKEKVIAEFWEGGGGTCTPPGFWIFFARCCVLTKNLDLTQEALLLYRMTASLFQVGILAWRIKRKHLQLRPIQSIRQLRPEITVSSYDGQSISSKQWMPYQEPSFVTPPFPDFVSGHSSFSSIGARVLTDFFGTNIIPSSKLFNSRWMNILSPVLRTMDPLCNMCSITVYPRQSVIQSTVPATGVTLSWTTWDQMAEEAGKSRIFGGIHYESSNQGGLALGRNLYSILFP